MLKIILIKINSDINIHKNLDPGKHNKIDSKERIIYNDSEIEKSKNLNSLEMMMII